MAAREARILADQLAGHYKTLRQISSKVDGLYGGRVLAKRDVDVFYAGVFLDAVTHFERFLEQLFVGLIMDSIRHARAGVSAKMSVKSYSVCHEILAGDRPYVDWLPYDYTVKRANKFLHEGHPFSDLDARSIKRMQEVCAVRNVLAHRSRFAQRKFENSVLNGLALRAYERTAPGYLRMPLRSAPRQTFFDAYIIDLSHVAHRLTS